MHTISFLFGAGADQCYKLCEGLSFIEPLIKDKYKRERKALLGEKSSYKLVYKQSKRIYLQTIANNKALAIEVFGQSLVDEVINQYNKNDSITDKVKAYCEEWYSLICETEYGSLASNDKKIVDFFLSNTVFFDVLDEKFNDLRNSQLHSNGNKVINAYTTIFILMIKSLYKINDNFSWTYEAIFDLLNKDYDNIDFKIESYYTSLKCLRAEHYISTTNYTTILESIIKSPSITYLHGKLNWFEDYKALRIYDCTIPEEKEKALKNTETLFPFILIPSGVKPIICKRQLLEFSKFIEGLDKSDILCVVGYRFNSEDNHINSIIAEWLTNKKNKLLYFNFNNSVLWDNNDWAKNFSRIDFNCETECNIDNLDIDHINAQIINLYVDGKVSNVVFNKIINYFNEGRA